MIRTAVRRSAAALALVTLLGVALVMAGPASADTPEPRPGSWEPKPDVNPLHAILFLGGVPLLVFIIVAVLVLAPSLARGESLRRETAEPEGQWIGGPRKAAGELAEPDTEGSAAGGAGGTW